MIVGYLCSVLVGVSLGLLGGGGSILAVPILVYILDVPPEAATAYSMFVVSISAAAGAGRYVRQGLVDLSTGLYFAFPSFAGVFLARRYVVPGLPAIIVDTGSFVLSKDTLIMTAFAATMLLAAVAMLRKGKAVPQRSTQISVSRFVVIALLGFGLGLLTGFVGAGGGFLIVPGLVLLAGLPIKRAIGTSLFVIALNTAVGFLGAVSTGMAIDWTMIIIFTACSVVGIVIGNIAALHIPGEKLKPLFGWFIIVMGVTILFQEWTGR